MEFIPLLPLDEFMSNIPRVEITEKALKILKIETALSGLGQKGTLEALVIRGASTKSLALLEEKAIIPKTESMTLMEVEEKEGKPKIPQSPRKKDKERLVDDLESVEKIKKLWKSGCKNTAEIARQIGYPRATVNENIRKMKVKGDLQE